DFAVCTHCKAPRNKRMYAQYEGHSRCSHCGLPEPFVKRKGSVCEAGWYLHYFHNRKVVSKRRLVQLNHNERKLAREPAHGHSASPASEFVPVQNSPHQPNPKVPG